MALRKCARCSVSHRLAASSGKLSLGVRSMWADEAAGHDGHRSSAEYASGRLHDQSWQAGEGLQLWGHVASMSKDEATSAREMQARG
eukprot:scaffold38245_cov33-Tisochrysis_lutea.AAC.5